MIGEKLSDFERPPRRVGAIKFRDIKFHFGSVDEGGFWYRLGEEEGEAEELVVFSRLAMRRRRSSNLSVTAIWLEASWEKLRSAN